MKPLCRIVIALVAGVSFVLAPVSAPAAANASARSGDGVQQGQDPQANKYPPSADLRGPGTKEDGGVGPAIAPSGCYGQTDRPHLSSHVPGSVNVVARTVCYGYLDYVTTNLYRSRWYGWQLRGSGSNTAYNTATTNASESAADCDGTHDYLATSYHENLNNGSYANTSNTSNGSLTC